VRLEPRGDAAPLPAAAVEAVSAAAFGQRRKMLRASLRSLWPHPQRVLEEIGIDPTLRAEQLSVDVFLDLARRLKPSDRAP
jgi:16S rRNA (adenine1518-N6/adenine1519-N6)-dimethyltransferase